MFLFYFIFFTINRFAILVYLIKLFYFIILQNVIYSFDVKTAFFILSMLRTAHVSHMHAYQSWPQILEKKE